MGFNSDDLAFGLVMLYLVIPAALGWAWDKWTRRKEDKTDNFWG